MRWLAALLVGSLLGLCLTAARDATPKKRAAIERSIDARSDHAR